MAFKMRRPIIKGTAAHKASIAKQKSIVSQARTQADPSLSFAAEQLGRSRIGKSVDYTIDPGKIEIQSTYEKELKQRKRRSEEKQDPPKQTEQALSIQPKQIKALPTAQRLQELISAGETPISPASEDRFEKAAREFGYDLSTPEGYAEAEASMEYSDRQDKWINPQATVGDVKKKTTKSNKKQDNVQKIQEEKFKASKLYAGVNIDDMISDGKGGYVPKDGAKSKDGDTWDSELGGWRDDATGQYFGPGGEKISPEFAEKLSTAQETKLKKAKEKEAKAKEIEAKNIKIRERNALIKEFKEANPGERVTQSALDAFQQDKIAKEQELLEQQATEQELSDLAYQDDPETQMSEQELEDIAYKPQVLPEETPTTQATLEKPNKKDFKSSSDYMRARMKYLKEMEGQEETSVMQKRDDRIFANANPGGVLRKNMIKSGYIPPNQR